MVNSSIMICSFSLKKRYSKTEKGKCLLNSGYTHSETGAYFQNAFDMIKKFCENNYNYSDDEDRMKMFSIKKESVRFIEGDSYNVLTFTVRSGAYGIEAEMTDIHTQEVNYRRKATDADIKEFKCLVFIPEDTRKVKIKKGIIIFQMIATYGVKTITLDKMKSFFAPLDLTFETRSVSAKEFVEKMIRNGDLKRLTLIKNSVSPNKADNMLIATGKEEKSYINPRLREGWLKQFLQFFDTGKAAVYEIEGEVYDDIKTTFKLGDRERTIRLNNLDKISVVEDVPDGIFYDGHCDGDKLEKYMIETAIAYKEKMIFS